MDHIPATFMLEMSALEFGMETECAERTEEKASFSAKGPKLAVSIVLYRPDNALLGTMLESLGKALVRAGQEGLGGAEVILTDHSRQTQSEAVLAGWRRELGGGAGFHYVHVGSNPGFGAGHNAAFRRAASADFFLVANPDLEFAPDSIAAGIAFFRAHPAVGLVAPALIEPDGGLRPACFRPPDLRMLALRAAGVGRAHPRVVAYECRDWDAHVPHFDPPLISGCCMFFRGETYARLGGFDPGYFLYFEDFDLSLRAGRLGLSAYHPAMRVKHGGGGASRKGPHHQISFLRSAWRYFATHGWRW